MRAVVQLLVVSVLLPLAPVRADAPLAERELAAIARGGAETSALSGLQVALLDGGRPGGDHVHGFAQLTDDGATALRADHRVRVASISKLVVAIAVLRLVEAGALSLDDDVAEILGFSLRNPAFPDAPIRVRHLLAHTSSLRDGDAYFIPVGDGQLSDFFLSGASRYDDGAHFDAAHAPGSYFTYANIGFGVLGSVIERASGQRFDRYLARAVLEPLGIAARFDPCALPREQLAAGFRKRGDDGVWRPDGPWVAQVDAGAPRCIYGMDRLPAGTTVDEALADYELGSNGTLFSPQGGLRASAQDLRVVLQLFAGGGVVDGIRLLSQASIDAMLASEWTYDAALDNGMTAGEVEPGGPTDGLMTSYGLSVHRIDPAAWGLDDAPALLVGHLGEAYGVLSHALLDPESGDGVVAIITGTADDPAQAQPGTSPLYRVEEEILRWWLQQRAQQTERIEH